MTDSAVSSLSKVVQPTVAAFGLQLVRDREGATYSEGVWANATTGLRVMIDRREQWPLVTLIRLDGGQPPGDYPVFVDLSKPLPEISLESLVELRGGSATAWNACDPVSQQGDDRLVALLKDLPQILERYAQDVLTGDFSVFEEVRARLKQKWEAGA